MNRTFARALAFLLLAASALPALATPGLSAQDLSPQHLPAPYLDTRHTFADRMPESGDALVLLVPEGAAAPALDGWSAATRDHVSRAIAAGGFTPTAGAELEVLAPVGLDFGRLILLGVGTVASTERHQAERIGASLSARLNRTAAQAVVVSTALLEATEAGAALTAAVAHGIDLRNYRFDRFLSSPGPRPAQAFTWHSANPELLDGRYQLLRALAEGVFTARELTNLPGRIGFPEAFAEHARAVLEPLGVEVTLLGPEEVRALGMGSLYSVSQGADGNMRSHLLVVRWRGSGGDPIALVGKGNTFDTGGYNLKTDGSSIIRMHTDKAGGAAVVGAVQALAGQNAPVHVVGVVPLSINLISGSATLPGDVVTAGDGSTVEIGSTDAEGRLILADGLWYAREHLDARALVDIATLTGAKIGALGTQYSALFTRDARIEQTLRAAGQLTGERVWPMPLAGYEGITRSRIADQINTGAPGAQAGALFLEHFAGDTPWAHIDMAGDAFVAIPQGIHPEGSTGHGVRLLTEWVLEFEGVR